MKAEIKVKLLNGQQPLEIIEKGDWIDLRTNEDIVLKAPEAKMLKRKRLPDGTKDSGVRKVVFDTTLIPLGVAIALPKGFEAMVLPRSGTFKNFSIILTNSEGVIDNSYRGNNDEWKFGALALADTTIPKGSRIAQFRIQPNQKATFWQKLKWMLSSGIKITYVDTLAKEDRGGIGSTGVK